jgi:CO/xanthine dehydrogenase Mo-binding subunit
MTLSPSLAANPLISTWLTVRADGTVTLRVGKAELGQGIHTALAQIALTELGLSPGQLTVAPLSTAASPDEGFTAGSLSTQVSGAAVRAVSAAARRLFIEAAARRAAVPASSLTVVDGAIRTPDGEIVSSYGSLAAEVNLDVDVAGQEAGLTGLPPAERRAQPDLTRLDLPDKVFGRPRFIQDLELPGMVHARVIRPPLLRAALVDVPEERLAGLPAAAWVERDGDFLAVLADREEVADAAAARLRGSAKWEPADDLPEESGLTSWLRGQRSETTMLAEAEPAGPASPGTRVSASYSRGLIAHASIATSCALARFDGRLLEVWSHTQGIFPLRAAIAGALGLDKSDVVVHHVEGAGCYGHNPADDVAFDAALLACRTSDRTGGRPVRVLWDRAAELGSGPLASAMTADVTAVLDPDGSVRDWSYDVWSNGYNGRPGYAGNPGLLANGYRRGGRALPPSVDPPLASGLGSGRNAVPAYTLGSPRVATHRLLSMPIRTSAIRSLGAHFNVFAIESFMDELAAAAGVDPLAFRLARLDDERARAVLLAAADAAGWGQPPQAADTGLGLGYARYKNAGAYCAVAAEVEARESVRVRRLVLAVDVGRVVNRDGVRNQIEGGAIQAASWTLKEQVRFGPDGVTSLSWETYPVLRFSEIPQVDVIVIDRPGSPSVGAGECTAGPVAGAIANGLFAAIGVRARTLPLTDQNVLQAIG